MSDRHNVYVKVSEERAAYSVSFPEGNQSIIVDLDDDGRPVGVEILDAVSVEVDGVLRPPAGSRAAREGK